MVKNGGKKSDRYKGFVDQLDYFVEHCKDFTCREGDSFVTVKKRVEKILRKGFFLRLRNI